jgi:hypothetical protein
LASAVFSGSCKDEYPSLSGGVIPVQTVAQAKVTLVGTSKLTILSGSSITNTGATKIPDH